MLCVIADVEFLPVMSITFMVAAVVAFTLQRPNEHLEDLFFEKDRKK